MRCSGFVLRGHIGRENQLWKKSVQKIPLFILKHLLSPVFARAFFEWQSSCNRRHRFLVKKRQKSSPFYFLRDVKASIYKGFFRHQSCGNRGHVDGRIKIVKKSPKSSPF